MKLIGIAHENHRADIDFGELRVARAFRCADGEDVHPLVQIAFYEGSQFPAEYRGDIFAAEHGSWNRSIRTGYEVIRVPVDRSGHAKGEYQDFVTGFVVDDGHVWGRPVGIAEAADGSLVFSDDASNSIWRVRYTGPN